MVLECLQRSDHVHLHLFIYCRADKRPRRSTAAVHAQLGTFKRYLKIFTDNARRYQTKRVRAFPNPAKNQDQEKGSYSSANLVDEDLHNGQDYF